MTHKFKANTPLERHVLRLIRRQSDTKTPADIKQVASDIMYGGLSSGIVGDLIYYDDTVRFFKKHRREIINLLKETMLEMGLHAPVELFSDKWDNDDPFAEEKFNQNLLAWFAFEEITRRMFDQ